MAMAHYFTIHGARQLIGIISNLITASGLSLDILKIESWTHMGRTANIIIKDVIHIFASISKIMRILLMGRRNRERCTCSIFINDLIIEMLILIFQEVAKLVDKIKAIQKQHDGATVTLQQVVYKSLA